MSLSANLLAIATTTILVFVWQTFATDVSWEADFTILGTINGKTFMVPINDTVHNVNYAQEVCSSSGLEMAMYRNRDEQDFVRANINSTQTHWLGGEIIGKYSSNDRTAFRWYDGTALGDDYTFMMMPTSWLCLYIRSGGDIILTDLCLEGRHKPLCQTGSSGLK